WLRYDDIDGKLVVSDLRMGIGTGHYSFRFLVGERDPETGAWRAVVPEYWRGGPAARDVAALKTTLQRIWQVGPPLPLAMWNKQMTQPCARAVSSACAKTLWRHRDVMWGTHNAPHEHSTRPDRDQRHAHRRHAGAGQASAGAHSPALAACQPPQPPQQAPSSP